VIALIYIRVSTEDQANEGLSLAAQLNDCRNYVKQHGWVIGTEFEDHMTGTRADRPQYQALLGEARRLRKEGKQVVVVVKWLNRFGRKIEERVRCWNEFKALGISIHSVAEGGLVQELVANILASIAQEESRLLSERVSDTWKHTRSLGWYQVGRPPWGYKWRPRTPDEKANGAPKLVLEIDEVAAPFVREAFERAAGGESARSVARWAATLPPHVRQGESLKTDRVMSWRAVQRTLNNPVYIARDFGSREQRRKVNPAEVIAHPKGQWSPILDDATWLRVQERLASHARVPHQASAKYLLTGFIRCSLCGQRMQGMIQGHGPRYRCSAWARGARATPCSFVASTKPVDRQVITEVTAILDTLTSRVPAIQVALRKAWKPTPGNEPREHIQRLEAKLVKLQNRIAKATEFLCDEKIDKPRYDELVARTIAESDETAKELAQLRSTQPTPSLPPLDELRKAAGSWTNCFLIVDPDTQHPQYLSEHRDVLALLIDRVVPVRIAFGKYRVEIVWTHLGQTLLEALPESTAAEAA
jgi:DNA invertase Pin-like site-specific DNA recombinase